MLVTDFGADANQVEKPIVPANAGDIGDRLILVPQQTHPAASEDEIREIILGLAEVRNVAVIVPSDARASYWEDDAKMILKKGQSGRRGAKDAREPRFRALRAGEPL